LSLRETRSEWSGEDNIKRSLMIFTAHQIYSGDEIGKNEVCGPCSTCGEMRDGYRVLVEKSEGKSPVGRSRRRLEDVIRIDFKKWDGDMDWIDLT